MARFYDACEVGRRTIGPRATLDMIFHIQSGARRAVDAIVYEISYQVERVVGCRHNCV
jgi:hypothetical protein